MQIVGQIHNNNSIQSWQDDTGDYIRGFLISTKHNKNKWKIKNIARVNDFIGKDFAVIPHRIGNSTLLDGHVVGTKEQVIQAYSDNSYGKIQKVLGPFEYGDGSGDVWFDHITKLTNNKVASALMQHGSGTLVPFATSPHIFGIVGDDITGWEEWEPAGIVLVSNPAYGEQSVITKSCTGKAKTCTDALTENQIASINSLKTIAQNYKDDDIANLISSLVNSDPSKAISMDTAKDTIAVSEVPSNDLTKTSLQVQETKVEPKIITDQDQIKPTQSQPQQDVTEEVKLLRQKVADMENKEKAQLLTAMFSVVSDEKEREKTIKEIAENNDLKTIEYIKTIVDGLAPLYKKQGETELQKQIKLKEDALKEQNSKFTKNKVASYKFQLPGEPSDPENPESDQGGEGGGEGGKNKIASSTKKIGEVAEFITLLKGFGGNS